MLREQKTEWAEETLGPVFLWFIDCLHAALSIRAATERSRALFCTRAGFRMKHLYQLYLSARGGHKPACEVDLFAVSRMLAAKSAYHVYPDRTLDLLHQEFASYSTKNAVVQLFPPQLRSYLDLPDLEVQHKEKWNAALERSALHSLFYDGSSRSRLLREWYRAECDVYNSYLDATFDGATRNILIDTGWSGTQLKYLSLSRPNARLSCFVFGRWSSKADWHLHSIRGLCFESEGFVPSNRATCITQYHHIIEDPLEPNVPSFSDSSDLARLHETDGDSLSSEDDHYRGILRYFSNNPPLDRSQILKNARRAWRSLEATILSPTKASVELAEVRPRSADFGKLERNSVILDPHNSAMGQEERLARALWKQGQLALEFDGAELTSRLARINKASCATRASGTVAIITRTKDRPVLLKRAADSIAKQTYSNYQWIVVNDAGELRPVLDVVHASGVDLRKVRIVNRQVSNGMEAASNAGLKAADKSDYAIVHDDDDAWMPGMLETAVAYLDAPPTADHKGVVVGTVRVSEIIVGEYSEEVEHTPYNDWVKSVELYLLLKENTFAPISFLFSRDVCEAIGGFNEKLPVLGDWEFNVCFLSRAEIGVIPNPLAKYYHRDRQQMAAYANSLTGSIDKHVIFGAACRNDLLRVKPLFLRDEAVSALKGAEAGLIMRQTGYEASMIAARIKSTGTAFPNDVLLHRLGELFSEIREIKANLGSSSGRESGEHTSEPVPRNSDLEACNDSSAASTGSGHSATEFQFERAIVNNEFHSDQYSHVQIIVEGISIPESVAWVDMRLCVANGSRYIEVFNHGDNYSVFLIGDRESRCIRLGRTTVELIDDQEREIVLNPTAEKRILLLASRALDHLLGSNIGMDGPTIAEWKEHLVQLLEAPQAVPSHSDIRLGRGASN